MNALHCISGKQYIFFHFTLGTMTFFADLRTLSFNNSWTWKATAKFLWKYSRKQQIHLWLAYPETSFIFSILLISTMRKICLCQCSQGAFNSGLVKIWLRYQDVRSSSPHWFMFHNHGTRQSSKNQKSANSTQISMQVSSQGKHQLQ